MSWKWEYAFSAEETARTAPSGFHAHIAERAEELVRAECLYIVQITYLDS